MKPVQALADQVVFTESGVNVVANETYAVIATGVVTPGDFETNPGGTSTAFSC